MSTLVKMSNCWKSHVTAQSYFWTDFATKTKTTNENKLVDHIQLRIYFMIYCIITHLNLFTCANGEMFVKHGVIWLLDSVLSILYSPRC